MISVAFYSHIKAAAAVAALCKQIYPHFAPQTAVPPFINYRVDDDARQQDLTGQGGYRYATIAVDVYDLTYLGAQAVANALESALIGYRGTLGVSTPAVDADHIRLNRRGDLYESETSLHRVAMQFLVGYE